MGAALVNMGQSGGMIQCECMYVHVCLCMCVSLLSRIVVGGNKGHLADSGGHCFFPDLDLDSCSILSECGIHVTHGDVLFQAGRGAAAGHLT